MSPLLQADDNETRSRYVIIDSRDRDRGIHPTPDKYEIRLEDDISDLVSMKLVAADVPFSALLVGQHNRSIPISLQDPNTQGRLIIDALLETGNYASPADMATGLSAALRTATNGSPFVVSHSPRTDSFSISCPGVPFWLCFGGSNTAARLLGFTTDCEYASDTNGCCSAPFRCDLSPPKYIILSVAPSAEVLCSTNNATNRTFAIIPHRYNELSIETDAAVFEKKWSPPLSRFSRISVSFVDYHGNPYDFQNQDHVLHLLFTSMRQHRNYRI